jgi:integrase/recombinase XerD
VRGWFVSANAAQNVPAHPFAIKATYFLIRFSVPLIPNTRLQTVASYRDTFRLLLQFVHRETGIEPAVLAVTGLDAEIILRFLDALEKDRGNSVASRNLRLTAIRSFYRMVALRDPVSVGIATRVLAIPLKRASTRVREYLTREEMEAILASIDRTHWCGRRDYALLLTMYNSGARVSEISGLRQATLASAARATFSCMEKAGRIDRFRFGREPLGC